MSSNGSKSFESRSSSGAGALIANQAWLGACVLAVLLLAPAITSAQQGSAAPSPAPQLIQAQQSSASVGLEDRSEQTSALAKPSYLTSVHGVQGVLAETDDGVTVAAQSVDEKFNPASSIKLATTLVALQTYGPGRRFMTALWTTGKIDSSTGSTIGSPAEFPRPTTAPAASDSGESAFAGPAITVTGKTLGEYAALVAAGVCDLALGTDTGGSIRIPAAACGIVGLKPTYGRLSRARSTVIGSRLMRRSPTGRFVRSDRPRSPWERAAR